MDWIKEKYINLISSHLSQFKKRGFNWNFRCPYCGDSKISKTKSRGWINSNSYHFYCFNCNKSNNFDFFLKSINIQLYDEYIKECFFEKKHISLISPTIKDYKVYESNDILKSLIRISDMDFNNPIKQYLLNRLIPQEYYTNLYAVSKFKEWVNTFIPNKFEGKALDFDEPRIIIPFYNINKTLLGFQGRSILSKSDIKYITISLNDEMPKIFGLDSVNFNKKVYVVEGCFDSMFLHNSIACCGSDLISWTDKISIIKDNLIIVNDNEPRNKEVLRQTLKTINRGFNVCIWPENVKQKDINEMILSGMTNIEIQNIIDNNIVNGLNAQLVFTTRKRVSI